MTLLELLVSITVIGILVALSLLGVQAAREASRRSECGSHLHQIGLAVASYESAYQVFPPGLSQGASLHVAILPFMEQDELHDQLTARFTAGNYNPFPELPSIPVFLCPSDGAVVLENGGAGTNYAGNSGTWWYSNGWDGVFIYWAEYAYKDKVGPVRASDVIDGMSNTFAVSELLRANRTWDRLRVRWKTPQFHTDIDALAQRCGSIPAYPQQYGWQGINSLRGVPWTDGNIGQTLNNHVLTPNQPSCKNRGGLAEGAYTAASNHRGGVNVLFADGHVDFYSDRVDVKLWRALASRGGGETH